MSTNSPISPPAAGSNAPLYELAFIKKCHLLIARGYEILNAPSLRQSQETEITGELVKAIRQFLETEGAPGWTAHFFVADDPPHDTPGKLGKSRRRVDIEFERGQHGSRPRIHFEAKRLYRSDSVSEYLGNEGLRLFVLGTYAPKQEVGGMLGYVQQGEPSAWIERIRDAMTARPPYYGFRLPPGLVQMVLTPGLDTTHLSHHDRMGFGRPIAIYHTLLRL